MEPAIESLKSQKLKGSVNITQTAKIYGVDRSTLSKRWRGVQGTRAEKIENQQLLHNQQEYELLQYIISLHKRGLPPSRPMIRNFAIDIAGKAVGKN